MYQRRFGLPPRSNIQTEVFRLYSEFPNIPTDRAELLLAAASVELYSEYSIAGPFDSGTEWGTVELVNSALD